MMGSIIKIGLPFASSAKERPSEITLKTPDKGIVIIAAVSAALALVLFQKNPNKKIANTPGDTKPVNSWMNWKACPSDFNEGAIMAAIPNATRDTILPIITNCFSLAYLLK